MAIKRILKINNSWAELFNFQNSFNFCLLELLRTAPLPIQKIENEFVPFLTKFSKSFTSLLLELRIDL